MSLIRKHGAVLQAWACLDLVAFSGLFCAQNAFRPGLRWGSLQPSPDPIAGGEVAR